MSKKTQPSSVPATATPTETTQSGGLFTSIKDALSKSLSLECSFVDERGMQTKVDIKNGAVRAEVTGKTQTESGSVIVKDKKMYFWNKQTGFMMELPDVDPKELAKGTDQGSLQAKSMMEAIEKYKDSCKPAVVADSVFTPPAEVKFQDLSKMMKFSSSAPVPSIDPKELQKYMQPAPTQ